MFRWPLARNVIRRSSKSNTFGPDVRRYPDGKPKAHQGWDFAAPIGTPCRAIGDGVVEVVEERGDYGLRVQLRLTKTIGMYAQLWAFYAHLRDATVKVGDRVTAGQVIGHTGESGNAKGMPVEDQHLHFEVRIEASPGLGCAGRISPREVYGVCPLTEAVGDP